MRSGKLHPSAIVTGAFGSTYLGPVKRWVVKRLYEHLARAYPFPEWTTMNYGYAPLSGEPAATAVACDAEERFALDLYWRVVTAGHRGAALDGLDLLEIGSGRGGGAAFLAQTLRPTLMTGLDIAEAATKLARDRYSDIPNLRFITGDAEQMGLNSGSVDIAINIESAHCYASVPRFLSEVARVLRPGGELMFAGFAACGGPCDRLVDALRTSPLTLDRLDDITPNIVASLARDEERKRAFLDAHVRFVFKSFAVGAYAMKGSAMRKALDAAETVYLAAVLSKP